MDRIDLTAADIVHDVALEVLEDDPYPTYAWMRRHRPVAFVPETGRVWITTWDLCDTGCSPGPSRRHDSARTHRPGRRRPWRRA